MIINVIKKGIFRLKRGFLIFFYFFFIFFYKNSCNIKNIAYLCSTIIFNTQKQI